MVTKMPGKKVGIVWVEGPGLRVKQAQPWGHQSGCGQQAFLGGVSQSCPVLSGIGMGDRYD